MSMSVELTLLGALIVVFIVSFCGLLHKIRKTYDSERILASGAGTPAENRDSVNSFMEIYINPSFTPTVTEGVQQINPGIFPGAPPPSYTDYYADPPPKYEDVIKGNSITRSSNTT